MPLIDSRHGITLAAHVGQRGVLLAFDLDEAQPALRQHLAGFAVQGLELDTPGAQPFWLANFLAFPQAANPGWQPSNVAPFQLFHWVHYPRKAEGRLQYTMWPVYFVPGQDPASPGGLKRDTNSARTVDVRLRARPYPGFALGFTRGFISSQGYLSFIQKKGTTPDIRPDKGPQFPLFDTAPFNDKYAWLGASARTLLQEFMSRWADSAVTVDVFAYDLDEPDVIRAIGSLGNRGRVIIDDSVSSKKSKKTGKSTKRGHGIPSSAETKAATWLKAQGVAVRRTHFARFSHDKVYVLKRHGVAEAVLTGSANLSVRGFYVQSNSVIVMDHAEVAGWYATAFQQAWDDPKGFAAAKIGKQWFAPGTELARLPALRVSFAPHKKPPFSIKNAATRLRKTEESVLFSIMTPTGTGDTLKVITRDLADRAKLLVVGTTENRAGVKAVKKNETDDTEVVPFDYLRAGVGPPFRAELSGQGGQHIHHKFVVKDFNGADPVVYCGSSNLAAGGEAENGDNLLEVNDRAIATAYAVEAIGLFDHYRFRSKERGAKKRGKPFALAVTAAWTADCYDPKRVNALQRKTYARVAS